MSELVEDGDEIVAIRVIELDEDGAFPVNPRDVVGCSRDQSDTIRSNRRTSGSKHMNYYRRCSTRTTRQMNVEYVYDLSPAPLGGKG